MEIDTKRDIGIWQFVGFCATSALGTLLHFLYDWTSVTAVALFSAVNESTWEHMKLIFFPMFLFAVIESFFVEKEYENYWCIKFLGTTVGVLLIPTLFYTLRGVFGSTPSWVNIAIFFVSAAVAYFLETTLFYKGTRPCKFDKISLAVLCAVAILFWVFTFIPPEIPLFVDPTDGTFGLVK